MNPGDPDANLEGQRKPRVDLGETPPLRKLKAQPWDVREWALGMISTHRAADARAAIAARTGIQLGSDTSYSDFCDWQLRQRNMVALREQAEREIAEAERWFDEFMPQATPEQRRAKIIERVTLRLAHQHEHEGLDVFLRRWQDEERLRIARAETDLRERRVALLEKREAETRQVLGSDLSPADKEARIREVFGLPAPATP